MYAAGCTGRGVCCKGMLQGVQHKGALPKAFKGGVCTQDSSCSRIWLQGVSLCDALALRRSVRAPQAPLRPSPQALTHKQRAGQCARADGKQRCGPCLANADAPRKYTPPHMHMRTHWHTHLRRHACTYTRTHTSVPACAHHSSCIPRPLSPAPTSGSFCFAPALDSSNACANAPLSVAKSMATSSRPSLRSKAVPSSLFIVMAHAYATFGASRGMQKGACGSGAAEGHLRVGHSSQVHGRGRGGLSFNSHPGV